VYLHSTSDHHVCVSEMSTTPPPPEPTGLESYTALVIAMEALVSSGVVGRATEGPLGVLRSFITGDKPVSSPVLSRLKFTKNATAVEGIHEVVIDVLRQISSKTHRSMSIFGSNRKRAGVQHVVATIGLWQGKDVEPCLKTLVEELGIDDPSNVKFA